MVEWHITPEYILDNWTDELFDLMVVKMIERKEAQVRSSGENSGKPADGSVSAEALSVASGGMIKVVNKSGD